MGSIVKIMTQTHELPSAFSTGVGSISRTLVVPHESIGSPNDPAASSIGDLNSVMSLLGGICAGLGVPVGSGAGIVNTSPHIFSDPLLTLGSEQDAPAAETGVHSAIALMKGLLMKTGLT